MFERLLDKSVIPTRDELIEYCGVNKERFIKLNNFLTEKMGTEESIRFPYGNHYGWCITHRIKKKLICDLFVEDGAFNLMMRLSNKEFDLVYGELHPSAKECVDNKYPCSDGGWIHFRILNDDDLSDATLLLGRKLSHYSIRNKILLKPMTSTELLLI